LKDANEGVLIHCTLGKDRTGMVFAVFLLLAEVPDAVIIREYGFSTSELSGYVERVEKYLKKVTKIHDEAIKRKAEDIVSARSVSLHSWSQSVI
jgi:protein tyrosine/serine phosphatase